MDFSSEYASKEALIEDLFTESFTASEGDSEGVLIGGLVKDMLTSTEPNDIYVCIASDRNLLAGCIVFSRMIFDGDQRTVFVLAPVAIKTEMQNMGIGQQLLNYGMDRLRTDGIDVVLTYGDPKFYTKVGFLSIDEEFAKAPFPLSYPHGWLGQALNDGPFAPLVGLSHCVKALHKPEYW